MIRKHKAHFGGYIW